MEHVCCCLDKKLGVCGSNSSLPPPMEECYTLIWLENGCFTELFKPDSNEKLMTIKQFNNYAGEIFQLAKNLYARNSNSELYRLICFQHISGSKNMAFNSQVYYVGKYDSDLYNPKNVVDGIFNNDISLGSCVILKPSNSLQTKLTIKLSGYHFINKVILWPTNENVNQLLKIYVYWPENLCADNIQVNNDSSTEVLCKNLQIKEHSHVTIEPKLDNHLHLCEIEILSNNIAYLKPAISKYTVGSMQTLVDGSTTASLEIRLGINYWIAINLLSYYNVFGLDVKPNLYNLIYFKNFYIELTNENPALVYNSTKSTLCAKKIFDVISLDDYYSFMCSKGGVKGQFVVFRSTQTPYEKVVIGEIKIFGYYLAPSNQINTNILLHKPTWASDTLNHYYAYLLTDGFYEAYFHTLNKKKPWARIDMLGIYRLFRIAIANRHQNFANRARYIRGLVSNYQDFSIDYQLYYSKICFINNDEFESGEYRLWDCQQPNPIGRFIILYLHSDDQYFNILEAEAYGEEIIDDDLSLLPLIKSDRKVDSNSFSNRDTNEQFPLKIIDGLSENIEKLGQFLSCSGTLTNDNIEGRITVYMNDLYMINQVVTILSLPLLKENFENVQVAVEIFNTILQRQICSLKNDSQREHLLYECKSVGDRVSFYKIGGNNIMKTWAHFQMPHIDIH
ncbi:DgyrCDS14402 [Dimorphilus gyrociliatus]|uniref:DgyrCDS14402 n=1 Tax=Dimorphilus gyrociliatus TaxID=2664684 RepID=A0A7I8WDI2_9ANNE|nr:DgyrCDS14402 [Dimorphilus gyrociliatus]